MIEKFKEAIDKGDKFGVSLTDLSKALDCIDHKLLIAKLYSYRISLSSTNLLFFLFEQSNATNRNQWLFQFKTGNWIWCATRLSILGPLLFNFDLIDLFFICENDHIASYADDTTPYRCARDTLISIQNLLTRQSTQSTLGCSFGHILITAWARALFLWEVALRMFWIRLWYFWKSLVPLPHVKRPTQNLVKRLGLVGMRE